MAKTLQTETQKLRRFGLVMAAACAAFGGLAVWRGHDWGYYLWYAGAAFLVLGLAAPRVLGPVERAWMAFAGLLGMVMTTVILTVTFFVVMTPIGLIVRATGKDLLGMRGDPEIDSYWVPVETDGPAGRPDKPY